MQEQAVIVRKQASCVGWMVINDTGSEECVWRRQWAVGDRFQLRDIKVGAILMCKESLSLTTERLMIALISKRYRE